MLGPLDDCVWEGSRYGVNLGAERLEERIILPLEQVELGKIVS